MLAWDGDELPQEVLNLARRVARWKRGRIGRARMPEELWAETLDLACEWGPYRAAQFLRLSYSTVKRRLDACETDPVPVDPPGPAFVEFLAPSVAGQAVGCVLELEGSGGSQIRVEVKAISAQDLLTVLRGLAA